MPGAVAAVRYRGRVRYMERAFDRARRRAVLLSMIDCVDQHAHTEYIRHQNEFLALVVAHLAGAGEEIDGRGPFGRGRLDLAHEGVGVLHQSLHHLLEPRIGYIAPSLAHDVGQGLFGHVRHRGLP